ncbi:histone deacetylase superfamily [Gonapodya prolifera JEL478]|uniref:Histone deacetylase n=1 Tax=Gonapodya prolifera (strain JEL478) TaxID=1344416 RepID=A0A139A3I4_GONPJ|nr:histone deacetylase superfamily [Gonapodya prolifera JEL478]|eukprot:KXS11377.1 histone deacetylase superfamily [Gonapodya prolifera JEL478]
MVYKADPVDESHANVTRESSNGSPFGPELLEDDRGGPVQKSLTLSPLPSSLFENEPLQGIPKAKIAYFFNPSVASFDLGDDHAMKPARVAIADALIEGYALYRKMGVFASLWHSDWGYCLFHRMLKLAFNGNVTPELATSAWGPYLDQFGLDAGNDEEKSDCPVFNGVYKWCQHFSGVSVEAGRMLTEGNADIAINYAGGIHHARRSSASGFCYINDIVLATLELLRMFPRVLYVDIDVHHGDGVQVLTEHDCYESTYFNGKFFPTTGSKRETGLRQGEGFSVNIPLDDHIRDGPYFETFCEVMDLVMTHCQPSAIVVQTGADSIAGDKLGTFNLSIRGHGRCIEYLKTRNLPMLVLGGGGYTIANVARAWTYECGLLNDAILTD